MDDNLYQVFLSEGPATLSILLELENKGLQHGILRPHDLLRKHRVMPVSCANAQLDEDRGAPCPSAACYLRQRICGGVGDAWFCNVDAERIAWAENAIMPVKLPTNRNCCLVCSSFHAALRYTEQRLPPHYSIYM